jgi:hypothetical protein
MSTVRAFGFPAAAVMVNSSMLVERGGGKRGASFFSNRRIHPIHRLWLIPQNASCTVTSLHNLYLD